MRQALAALAGAALVAGACAGSASEPAGPFNVVLIMADDLSADAMARGFHRSLDAPSALVLLEPVSSPNQPQTVPRYRAVRTPTHVYIEYETGDTELYDLAADPPPARQHP